MFSRKTLGILMNALLTLLFLTSLHAQNWPMADGGIGRTCWANLETELTPPFEKAHEFSLNGSNASGMSFYDGMLFVSVGSAPNNVIAFDAETGVELWRFEIPNSQGAVNIVPAINDSLVLCGGQKGLGLYALDRLTGAIKWLKSIGNLYTRNPILDEDRVYIVKDSLYCLDVSDGSTRWSFPFSAQATPAVDSQNVFVCGSRKLLALNKMTGELVWEIDNSEYNFAPLAIDRNFIYTMHDSAIVALRKTDHALQWSYRLPEGLPAGFSNNTIAITDSILSFIMWENAEQKGELIVLDKLSGTRLWRHSFASTGAYPAAIANGVVYIVNWREASAWGFDLITGEEVFHDASVRYVGQPIVADHTLFFGARGHVISFKSTGSSKVYSRQNRIVSFALHQNYPNPFNPTTTIAFDVPHATNVELTVFDMLGRQIAMLVNKRYEPGRYDVRFDASRFASGVYFYRVRMGDFEQTRKMLLVR